MNNSLFSFNNIKVLKEVNQILDSLPTNLEYQV